MDYVKVVNSEVETYPYSIRQLKADNPNTGFPPNVTESSLAEWNVYPMSHLDAASHNARTHIATQQTTPTFNNDRWELGWDISEQTEEQIALYDEQVARGMRQLRDELLEETDWQALSDVTMSSEMTAYRQSLRDITTSDNWPHLDRADWPTKP